MVAAFKTRERILDWDQRAFYNHVMEEFRKSGGLPHECPPIPGVAKGDEYEHALDQFFRERAKWVEGNHMEGRPVPQPSGPDRAIPECDRIIDGVRTEYVKVRGDSVDSQSAAVAKKAFDCIDKRASELVVEVTGNPLYDAAYRERCISRARGVNPNVTLKFRNGSNLE
jgi:hypothetical protein